MITPDEILNEVEETIKEIKEILVIKIDEYLKNRGRSLKELQIVQYEIEYQAGLHLSEEEVNEYLIFKDSIIKAIKEDYSSAGWIVEEKLENGKTVLNFATEKIMKHRESCKTGYAQ